MTIILVLGADPVFGRTAAAQETQFVEYMQPVGVSSYQYTILLHDVSNDGVIAVGSKRSERPLVWEGGGNAIQLGFAPHVTEFALAYGVSPDGSLIAGGTGSSYHRQALLWRDRAIEYLPHPEADVTAAFSEARDVSNNGVVVGTANINVGGATRKQAVRWVDGVMEPLPDPSGVLYWTEGRFVSADGSVIVGRARMGTGYRAVRWTNGLPEFLDTLVPDGNFDPLRMNDDGSVIVGSASNGTGNEAVRWADGETEGLGFLPGGTRESAATGVRNDGNLIVGHSVIDPEPTCIPDYRCTGGRGEGFVWTPETGMLGFEEWFRYGCGFDVVNWHIGAQTISTDGRTLYVAGSDGIGANRRFLVDVDECTTDYQVPEWKTQPGDYYVSDYDTSSIFRMHGVTGELEELTSFQKIYHPTDLAMGLKGEVYVLSRIWNRIVRFDPRTGEQTVVSERGLLENVSRIVVGVDGTLYVGNIGYRSFGVVRVDPDSGEQSILARDDWFETNGELTEGPNGNLLTLSRIDEEWKIIEIDVETGEPSVVTTVQSPATPGLALVVYDPRTNSLRARRYESDVIDIDLDTGEVTVMAERTASHDLATASAGDVISIYWGALYRTVVDTLETKLLASGRHLGSPSSIVEILSRCSDGLDNDGDGHVDADDAACISSGNDSEEFRTDVRIDILPGDADNLIALHEPGPIPVLLFGADNFDVRTIDGQSLAFGPLGAASILDLTHWLVRLLSYRDSNWDGSLDLSLIFALDETGIGFTDTEACLEGEADEIPFKACDDITIETEPWCGEGFEIAFVIPVLIVVGRARRRMRSRIVGSETP